MVPQPRAFGLLALAFALAGCIGEDAPPDASSGQVRSILAACGVAHVEIERQDRESQRLVASLAADEPWRESKRACLVRQQDEQDVGFTIFG